MPNNDEVKKRNSAEIKTLKHEEENFFISHRSLFFFINEKNVFFHFHIALLDEMMLFFRENLLASSKEKKQNTKTLNFFIIFLKKRGNMMNFEKFNLLCQAQYNINDSFLFKSAHLIIL